MTAIKEQSSTVTKLSQREKASVTDETARAIIASETSRREEKTERLRLARLQRETTEASVPESGSKRRKASKDH